MKILLATLVSFSLFAVAWSITCYRCGGASPECSSSNTATVKCDSEEMPNAVFACRVYTVNYTTLNKVVDFKSCCFYEDCNDDPCKDFGQGTVCSKMASCQSDRCNYNYTTAMGGPRPTISSNANIVSFHGHPVTALIIYVMFYFFM